MSRFPPDLTPTEHHDNAIATVEGSDVMPAEEVRDMKLSQDLSESEKVLSSSFPPELNEEELDSSWNQDGDLQGCGQ